MEEPIVTIEHVSKSFGNQQVLTDISFSMEKGKIYGLIGRNGSGKTVLLKCICGFLTPTAGEIRIDGQKTTEKEAYMDKMGIIIETPGFLPGYSAYKNLKMLAMIRKSMSDSQIRDAIISVGLDPDSPKKVGKFSMGMRQRLGIAQAIMENPEILLLDEPMNGLDNHGVADMRKLFLEMRNQGKVILLASHNKEDIEFLCDDVFTMDAGILSRLSSAAGI